MIFKMDTMAKYEVSPVRRKNAKITRGYHPKVCDTLELR